jgi:hypothetical protein
VADEHFGNGRVEHVTERPESCCSWAGDDRFGVSEGRGGAAGLECER